MEYEPHPNTEYISSQDRILLVHLICIMPDLRADAFQGERYEPQSCSCTFESEGDAIRLQVPCNSGTNPYAQADDVEGPVDKEDGGRVARAGVIVVC